MFALPLAVSAFLVTLGMILIFLVMFPLLIHGLLAFTAAQVAEESRENQSYLDGESGD